MKTRKMCRCGAFVFQGPFKEGEIHDGKMKTRATLYRCINCGTFATKDELADAPIPELAFPEAEGG